MLASGSHAIYVANDRALCQPVPVLSRLRPLWDPSLPSVLEHVRAHLPADDRPGLLDGGEALPDEVEQDGAIRWAPGALDGVSSHHIGLAESDTAQVDGIVSALVAAGSGKRRARAQLYELAKDAFSVDLADPLLERIRALSMPLELIQSSARWLVTQARHRGPVKLGIILLGLGHTPQDSADLKALGRHEEFTMFVSVALANNTDDPESVLFEEAKSVDGWGRIDAVERLADTDNPQIRDWIFRHGFRNQIMYEYLAYIAATTGDLVGHLRDNPDDEALDAACDIVSALISGGPARDIHDYADAAEAVELLLIVLADRASKLSHFLVADEIEHYLDQAGGEGEPAASGWSERARRTARALAGQIKAQPQFSRLAAQGLLAEDDVQFHQAATVARLLGQDTLPAHLRRLEADPLSHSWWGAMRLADEERISEIVSLAERILPLDDVATGPGTSNGLGLQWRAHQALDFIVQDLAAFPGHGWALIQASLRSPVIRNRNMAINALFGWGREHWPPDAQAVIERAYADEPDADVSDRLGRLLRGEADAE